jgi:hypothetical protein
MTCDSRTSIARHRGALVETYDPAVFASRDVVVMLRMPFVQAGLALKPLLNYAKSRRATYRMVLQFRSIPHSKRAARDIVEHFAERRLHCKNIGVRILVARPQSLNPTAQSVLRAHDRKNVSLLGTARPDHREVYYLSRTGALNIGLGAASPVPPEAPRRPRPPAPQMGGAFVFTALLSETRVVPRLAGII